MIQISNLTKVYKSKKKNNHKALDNLNLTLPNNGLVFVIGKSGSGKSTLLNLLGGLDNITSGNIIVDGNDITKFKENDLSNYRNNHIGFIFQDYHLLDELTVYENIVLSLNLNRLDDNDKVKEALEKVGLSGYENRFPSELSGGERQRVAIARAIVKKPYIILADEPTGNLDNETGTQIIELLKGLSKDCLILIVSHNTIDTYKYADRIIKLSNGKIISDESKNPNYINEIKYENNTIYYPIDKSITDSDIDFINKRIIDSNVNKIEGIKDKYISTTNVLNEERNIDINKNNLSIKDIFKLCLTFLKTKVFRITASSFMIAVIMVILALAETIITFDSGDVISNEMDKIDQSALFIEKFLDPELRETVEYNYYAEVTQSDIEKFKEKGFKDDEILEVLNYTVPISNSEKFAGRNNKPLFSNSLYILETLGTLIVDEDYLVDKYGKLEYVLKLDEFHPSGVLITDYVADCILASSSTNGNKTYEDILGLYHYSSLKMNRGYINGIIKTNYKEKYQGLFDDFRKGKISLNSSLSDNRIIEFTTDIYTSLGFSYTLNENFKNDLVDYDTYQSVWHYFLTINGIPYYNDTAPQIWQGSTYGFELKDNEVLMNIDKYNEFFGTNYKVNDLNKFVPHEITLNQYRYCDLQKNKELLSEKLIVKGLTPSNSNSFYVSDTLYKEFKENLIYTKGLYLKNNDNIGNIFDLASELNFEQSLFIVEGIHTMTKAVDVFIPIFELVAIVLCAGIIFILISFSTKMVKDKMHDIGILKALGCKNSTIGIIFGLQLLLIALCTIILSTIGYFFFIDLANDVLIESLKILAPSHIVLDLDFLTFKINVVGVNSLLVILLTIVSFIIPMLKIHNIKPVQIIKTKE